MCDSFSAIKRCCCCVASIVADPEMESVRRKRTLELNMKAPIERYVNYLESVRILASATPTRFVSVAATS